MAEEECSASSIATSSPTPTNWWPDHATSLSPWTWQNPNSSNCDDDAVSISTSNFTAASNHSSLTVESSRRQLVPDFIAEHAPDTHIWTHLLSSVNGTNGDHLQSTSQDAAGIYEPPFDYLKKMDHNNWEFPTNPSINNFDKNLNNFNYGLNIDSQRLTVGKLSNLVNNWSIAPPETQPSYTALLGPAVNRSPGFLSCMYGNDNLKNESERPFNAVGGNNGAYQIGLHCSAMETDRKYSNYYGPVVQSPYTSSVTNGYTNGLLTGPLVDIHGSKPSGDTYKKQTLQPSPSTTSKERNQRNSTSSEGKKKRSEDSSETGVKKPKNEGSAVSSVKMLQAPKVKLADKITALQQIVSPFGKTDTASVLLEAIGYIKFLQEQVQLLSNPYMKTSPHKDQRKEKEDSKFDLRSRGLCLVPVSCTPQVYRENSGSDYWTPTYRGCLYR